MMQLTPAQEDRARRLHRESTIVICHDHDLFPDDLDAMKRGGVTAKQVHICVDGLVWTDRETFHASETMEEGYLRRAMVALDYIHGQVEGSGGRGRPGAGTRGHRGG